MIAKKIYLPLLKGRAFNGLLKEVIRGPTGGHNAEGQNKKDSRKEGNVLF